jgi:hypothetical protein
MNEIFQVAGDEARYQDRLRLGAVMGLPTKNLTRGA